MASHARVGVCASCARHRRAQRRSRPRCARRTQYDPSSIPRKKNREIRTNTSPAILLNEGAAREPDPAAHHGGRMKTSPETVEQRGTTRLVNDFFFFPAARSRPLGTEPQLQARIDCARNCGDGWSAPLTMPLRRTGDQTGLHASRSSTISPAAPVVLRAKNQ